MTRLLPLTVLAAAVSAARSGEDLHVNTLHAASSSYTGCHSHASFSQDNDEETELAENSFLDLLRAGETEISLTAFGEEFVLDVQPRHPFLGAEVLVEGVFAAGSVRGISGSHVRITAVGTIVQGLIDFPGHHDMQSIEIRTTDADAVELHRQMVPAAANDTKGGEGVVGGSRSRRVVWPPIGQTTFGGGQFSWPPPPPPYQPKVTKKPYPTGKKFSNAKDTCTMFLDVDSSVVNKIGETAAETLVLQTFAVVQDAFERNHNLGIKLVLKGYTLHTQTSFDSIASTTDFGNTFANYKAFLETVSYSGNRKDICLNHAIVLKAGLPRCGDAYCECKDKGAIAAGLVSPSFYTGHAHVAGDTNVVDSGKIVISSTCGSYENPKWGYGNHQSKLSTTGKHKGIGAAVSAIGFYDFAKKCNAGAVNYATADWLYKLYPQREINRIFMHEVGHQLGAHHDCQEMTACGGDAAALSQHRADCARGSSLDHAVMSYGKGYMNLLAFSECSVKDIDKYLTWFDTIYAQQSACFVASGYEATKLDKGIALSTFVSKGNADAAPAGICTTLKVGFEDDSSFYFYFYEMANGVASWYSASIELYLYRDSEGNRWVISPYLGSCKFCTCSTTSVIYEGADVDGDDAADAANRVWTPHATHAKQSLLSVTCAKVSTSNVPAASNNQLPTCVEPKTCSQLGWTRIVNGVCGESDEGLGLGGADQCFTSKSWHAARNKCSKAGARLCTVRELQSGVTATTGCQLDGSPVWSSSWCGLGNKRSVVKGNGQGEVRCESTSDDRKFGTRCCSDVNFAATTNSPATTTTTVQRESPKSCATLGWAVDPTNSAVCGESNKGFECSYEQMQPDANVICARAGGRLCTKDEIMGGVGMKTGCSMDHLPVWTSGLCGPSKYWTSKNCKLGSANWLQGLLGTPCSTCTPITELFAVRCCSDAVVVNAYRANSATQSKNAKYSRLVKAAKVQKASKISNNGGTLLLIAGIVGAVVVFVGAAFKMLLQRNAGAPAAAVSSAESAKEVENEVKLPLLSTPERVQAKLNKNRGVRGDCNR